MVKLIFTLLSLILLSGCDSFPDFSAPPPNTAKPTSTSPAELKWAVVNYQTLVQRTKDALALKQGQTNLTGQNEEVAALDKEQRELLLTMKQECRDKYQNDSSGDGGEDTVEVNGNRFTVRHGSYNAETHRAIAECTNEINNDWRMQDLNNKREELQGLGKDLSQEATSLITAALPRFAYQEGYDVVITDSSKVLYQKDNARVDVTEALYDFIVAEDL